MLVQSRFVCALAAIGAWFAFLAPAGASAATGQLTFADCLTSDTNTSACTPVPGANAGGSNTPLGSVYGVAASADGTSVYAISGPDAAVTRFARNPATGALSFVACITSDSLLDQCEELPGSASFGTNTPLTGLRDIAISPDGRNLYVGAESGDAVSTFARDPATGGISFVSCITSNISVGACAPIPGAVAGGTNTGLDSLRGIAVSRDGVSVYAGSSGGDAIATFIRDPVTGALTFAGCLTSNTSVGGCTAVPGAVAGGTNTGLREIYSVAVSPGGDNVYTAAFNGHAIARFTRAANGTLTYADCLSSATDVAMCASVPGATADGDDTNLANATSVTVSADGRSVYASAENAGGVTHFERNLGNGALTQQGCFSANSNATACTQLPGPTPGASGTFFQYPEHLVVSPDGFSVYAAAYSDSLARFARDPVTGALTFSDCLTSDMAIPNCAAIPGATANGADSPLQSAASIAISADGRNVYVGAEAGVVSRFDRELPPPAAPPSNEFSFGKLKRNKRKGTAKLTVELPGPGLLALGGKGVKPAAREATAAGALKLPVKAKGKRAKRLRKRGKAKLKAEVTFTPSGGEANTQAKSVKLIRRR